MKKREGVITEPPAEVTPADVVELEERLRGVKQQDAKITTCLQQIRALVIANEFASAQLPEGALITFGTLRSLMTSLDQSISGLRSQFEVAEAHFQDLQVRLVLTSAEYSSLSAKLTSINEQLGQQRSANRLLADEHETIGMALLKQTEGIAKAQHDLAAVHEESTQLLPVVDIKIMREQVAQLRAEVAALQGDRAALVVAHASVLSQYHPVHASAASAAQHKAYLLAQASEREHELALVRAELATPLRSTLAADAGSAIAAPEAGAGKL